MSQDYFYPNFQPPSYFGNVINAILGRNTGKFRRPQQQYLPLNQKLILIDTSPGSLMNVAMQVPHLNTAISTGAELFSQMEVKHINKDGEEIENSKVLGFLKQPNPLQTMEQYMYEFYVLNAVYNKTFQYKIQGLSFEKIPKAMWLLPSGWMKINATGKVYRQTDINEIIESYEMYNDDQLYEVDRVIYMAEGIGNNVLNPVSRIEALQIPLSNIVASLKSRNIIVTERGMIGFMTPDGKPGDSDGVLPLDRATHDRVKKEYQDMYNLDSMGGHVGFPGISMKWVPMTFDIKQLGLIEGTEDDFGAILNAYRLDRDIFASTKGATYENKAAGLKSTIQNGMKPLADKLMNQLTKHLIDEKTGEKLIASYDYLPAMKEDERLASQGKLYLTQAVSQMITDGLIDHVQAAEILDVEFNGTGKVMQPAKPTVNPTADNNQKSIEELLKDLRYRKNGNHVTQ